LPFFLRTPQAHLQGSRIDFLVHEGLVVGFACWPDEVTGEWELESRSVELLDVSTFAILVLQLLNLDDLDGTLVGPVASSHIIEQLLDGTSSSHIPELLVYIVCTSSAVVTQENAIVSGLQSALGSDGLYGNDLTACPLHLL